jgi:hypothetical protein
MYDNKLNHQTKWLNLFTKVINNSKIRLLITFMEIISVCQRNVYIIKFKIIILI